MSGLSFIARFLIATALISSAYLHYQHPTKATPEFISNYKLVDELSNKFLEFDIPYDNTNWIKIVKGFGGFEALVAILVLSGDSFGGVAYLISLIFQTFFLLWPKIAANSLLIFGAWRREERVELSKLICLIGVALVLMHSKSKPQIAATK